MRMPFAENIARFSLSVALLYAALASLSPSAHAAGNGFNVCEKFLQESFGYIWDLSMIHFTRQGELRLDDRNPHIHSHNGNMVQLENEVNAAFGGKDALSISFDTDKRGRITGFELKQNGKQTWKGTFRLSEDGAACYPTRVVSYVPAEKNSRIDVWFDMNSCLKGEKFIASHPRLKLCVAGENAANYQSTAECDSLSKGLKDTFYQRTAALQVETQLVPHGRPAGVSMMQYDVQCGSLDSKAKGVAVKNYLRDFVHSSPSSAAGQPASGQGEGSYSGALE